MGWRADGRTWAGRIASGIAIVFLTLDAAGKLLRAEPFVRGTVELGYPDGSVAVIGALLLFGVLLYAIPRTSILGAIWLTGFLGGAVATHFRLGSPLFTHQLFGIYVAVIVWAGLVLRNRPLAAILFGARR